jgi:hypothetical protein
MGKKTQVDSEVKVCRVCGDKLVIGENWTTYKAEDSQYTCQVCSAVRRRESREPRTVNRASDPSKRCRVCRAELIPGENCVECHYRSGDYICRVCSRAAAARYKGRPGRELVNWSSNKTKRCRVCKVELTPENWRGPGGDYICKACSSAATKVRGARRRAAVIAKYGGACACCGETRLEFLTIDHINGGGAEERGRTGTNFYITLHKAPKRDDLRVLCMNCNWAIGMYGYCPHEQERAAAETVDFQEQRYG